MTYGALKPFNKLDKFFSFNFDSFQIMNSFAEQSPEKYNTQTIIHNHKKRG